MNRIFKYSLDPEIIGEPQFAMMPKGAVILDADFQDIPRRFVVWANVNPDNPLEKITFWILFTGMQIPDSVVQFGKHLQTRQVGSHVFHVFYI